MFFIAIFGVQDKLKQKKVYQDITCRCGALSEAELIEKYRYFHIFFIPIYKWKKEYLVRMRCCHSLFVVPAEYADDLRRGGDFDVGKLETFISTVGM